MSVMVFWNKKSDEQIQSYGRLSLQPKFAEKASQTSKKALAFSSSLRTLATSIFQRIAGPLYEKYIIAQEWRRIWTYRAKKESEKQRIVVEIFGHSWSILGYLFVAIIIAILGDIFFWLIFPSLKSIPFLTRLITLPPSETIELGLQVIIGAISTLLGLLFALFAVGFQITTEKYSQSVVDFMNKDEVSDYYFRFLIFTDIFAIVTLLRSFLFEADPVVSFFVAVLLALFSLLGIFVFRKHYLVAHKPLRILESLWRKIRKSFTTASTQNSCEYQSWNLVTWAKRSTNEHLDITGDLFRDLRRTERWSEAAYVPVTIGEIIRDYTDARRFVDSERGHWFYKRLEKVSADDLNMLPVKMHYERRGRGPFHMEKLADDWVEDKCLELIEEAIDEISNDPSGELSLGVIKGLQQALIGDNPKDGKLERGALQNQELEIFNKALSVFLTLNNKIDFKNTKVATTLLNNYFAISIAVCEAWDIELSLKTAQHFYRGDQLRDRHWMPNKTTPAYERYVLIDYWQRLELEQVVEGRIVTPKKHLINEIKETLETKRNNFIEENLEKFFENTDQIIHESLRNGNREYAAQFLKMQHEWITCLLNDPSKRHLASHFSKRLINNVRLAVILPSEVLTDLEFLEQAEKGFFLSLIVRNKGLFSIYSRFVVIVIVSLRHELEVNEENLEKLERYSLLPLVWGGAAYLVSELTQDKSYLLRFVKSMERLMFKPGWMHEVIKRVSKLHPSIQTNFWKGMRYHNWYMELAAEIRELRQRPSQRARGEIGFSMEYDHPSPFIQKLAMAEPLVEEMSARAFTEWLEKQAEVRKIASILRKVAAQKVYE